MNPTISMRQTARYVTQANVFDTFYLGALTDAKITRYAKAGKYGPEAQKRALARQGIRKAKLVRKKTQQTRRQRLLTLLEL